MVPSEGERFGNNYCILIPTELIQSVHRTERASLFALLSKGGHLSLMLSLALLKGLHFILIPSLIVFNLLLLLCMFLLQCIKSVMQL